MIGSGGTYTGLKIGVNINGIDTKIHGISVNLSKKLLKKHIVEEIKGALKLPQQPFEGEFIIDFLIDDSYIGSGGYGVPTIESLKAVKIVAETEGIILDPIYTGKAFAGLVDYIRKGLVKKEEKILFWHTGGIPNFFFHADAFNQIL